MLQVVELVRRTDDRIEAAWRERNWSSFFYLLLATTATVTIFAFLLIIVPGIVYLEVMRAYYFFKASATSVAGTYAALWNFAIAFGAIVLMIGPISGIVTMLAKEIGGDFKTR